jgi:hypothetical protein
MYPHQWRSCRRVGMVSTFRYGLALMLAASLGLSAPQTRAQPAPVDDHRHASGEVEASAIPDPSELDWSQLDVDASTLMKGAPASKPHSPQAGPAAGLSWSGNDKPNGSAAVSVKQPLSPLWDARIGADMTVARDPAQTESQLLAEKLANGGNLPQSSGTAWAAVTAPGLSSIWDKTAVEARLDPTQEQSKLGTSLSKSIPFSEQYSLTLQNGYNVTEQGALPLPGIPGRPARNYDTEQSARLSIAETGTSFMAGQTLSTADDKWLRRIGAEQKLFGDVTINGSIGETPQGATSKSVTAGFKRSW